MTFVRYKKFGNKEYAYEIKGTWNSTKKKPVLKSKYLGVVLDKDKKIYQKSRDILKKEKLILDFGDVYTLNHCFRTNGFYSLLEETFEEDHPKLSALLLYKICYGSAMMYAKAWLDGSYAKILYKKLDISSQRISDFLVKIGDENLQRNFFKKYFSAFINAEKGIIIDVTSLPNQIHIPLSSWGLSGEEIDKQIRFLLVVDRESKNPLFFRILPGNIVDVSTLQSTIAELKKYGIKNSFVYVDAGFFSEDNIKELYENNIDFLIRLPSIRTLYNELIRTELKDLESLDNVVRYGKRGMFIKQKEVELFGKKVYAHIVLDPERKGREMSKLITQIIDEKDEHKESELENYFLKRGIMILISSSKIEKKEVVPTYYVRQTAENLFGFSKDDLGIIPLRVHREATLRGFLFLQFITLIAFMQIKNKLGKEYTVEEAMLNLRNLKCKVYDNETLINEPTKQQKEIADKLGILMPKFTGI